MTRDPKRPLARLRAQLARSSQQLRRLQQPTLAESNHQSMSASGKSSAWASGQRRAEAAMAQAGNTMAMAGARKGLRHAASLAPAAPQHQHQPQHQKGVR